MVRRKPRKEPAVIKQPEDQAGELADSVIDTVREPLIALDQDLKVVKVNRSFYETFKLKPEETVGRHIYELGNKQLDIPRLRELLESIIPQTSTHDSYEIEYDFPVIGWRTLLINARQIPGLLGKEKVTLLAIEDITERKLLEKALAERADKALSVSEGEFRALVENINDVLFTMDSRGNITYVSPVVERFTRYKVSDLTGKPFISIIYPDDLPGVLDSYNRLMNGQPEPLEYRVLDKDGRIIFVRSSSQTIYKDGQIGGITGLMTDITERKKAEEAVQASERKFKSIVEHITDIFYVLNLNYEMIYISPQAEKVMGYTLEEVRHNWQSYLTDNPINLAAHEKTQLAVTTGEKQEPYLQEFMDRNGTRRLIEINESPLKDDKGQVTGMVGAARDMTERKKSEDAIQRSKNLLQTVIDSTPDWMYVKDFQHKFLLVNRSFADSQNVAPQDMIGKTDTEFFSKELCFGNPDKGIAGFHADDLQAFQGQLVHNPRNIISWPDGSLHIYDSYKIPLTDQSGQIYGALVYSRDMTEQRKVEDEREAALVSAQKTMSSMISTMSRIVEMRDPYTAGHQKRVADLSGAIAREMKIDNSQVEHLEMAARIHDIGKMYIPSDILNKPGKLSDIELNLIRTHVQGSFDILQDIEFSQPVALMALQHHERLDGSGYPNGLKSGEIMIEAKILAVADVVEAMSSHRPYRPAPGIEKALEEIYRNKGTLYDRAVVDTCLELFNAGKFEFKAE